MGGSGVSSSVKMQGSGESSSMKVRPPELTVGCIWLALWPAAYPRELHECKAGCSKLAVGGDEWLEIFYGKRNSRMMVSRAAKNLKWWCSGADLLWFVIYALERKFRAENGGLLHGTYPICIYMEVPPPPPPPHPDQRVAGSIPVRAWHFCPSARHLIHIADINVYKWAPGRMRIWFVMWISIVAPVKMD